jgi:hypothetical protein
MSDHRLKMATSPTGGKDKIEVEGLPASFLGRPFAYSETSQFGKARRARNIETVEDFLRAEFCEHKPLRSKELDGAVIYAELKGSSRCNGNVLRVTALAYDFDRGQPMTEALTRFRERGLAHAWYTSFNHGRSTRSQVATKRLPEGFDAENVRAHLLDQGWYPPIVERMLIDTTIIPRTFDPEGRPIPEHIVVQHEPLDKFRVIVFLEEPFEVGDPDDQEHRARELEWRERYLGFANELGLYIDRSCSNPARIFFRPGHPVNATNYEMGIWAPSDDPTLTRWQDMPYTPRKQRGAAAPQYRPTDTASPDMELLRRVLDENGPWLDLVGILDAYLDPADIRSHQSDDKIVIACPHDDLHSNPGDPNDTGCCAWNATADDRPKNRQGGDGCHWPRIGCLHDGCKDVTTLDHICRLIEQGILCVEIFLDPANYDGIKIDSRPAPITQFPPRSYEDFEQDIRELADGDPRGAFRLALQIEATVTLTGAEKVLLKDQAKKKGKISATAMKEAMKQADQARRPPSDKHEDSEEVPEDYDDFSLIRTKADLKVIEMKYGQKPKLWSKADFALRRPDIAGAKKPTDAPWFDDPDVPVWEGFMFEPDPAKAAQKPNHINRWVGFAIEIPAERPRGSWRLLRKHVYEVICKRNKELFRWVMTWMAHLVQRPGEKLGSCLILVGPVGTGKSKLFDWLKRLTAPHSFKISGPEHLVGRFNEHLDALVFLQVEEAAWGGEVRKVWGKLKDLITSETISIDGKFEPVFETSSYVRIGMTANPGWTIPVSIRDRRPCILEVSECHMEDHAYFAAIDAEMTDGGLEAMMYDLAKLGGLDFSILRKPPITTARGEQARYTMDLVERFFVELVERVYDPRFPDQVALADTAPRRVSLDSLRTELNAYLRDRNKLGIHYSIHTAAKEVLGEGYRRGVTIWEKDKNRNVAAVELPSRREAIEHLRANGIELDYVGPADEAARPDQEDEVVQDEQPDDDADNVVNFWERAAAQMGA